jgi:hypothetical protein
MSARRRQLVAAFERNDHEAIRAGGWWPVWELCTTAWAQRQTATAKEMVPYAKLLGDEDPADVLEALEACAGEWRPVPGQLRGFLNSKRGAALKVDAGRSVDPASTPDAIAAVADAVRAGEPICDCGGPTARKWRIDAVGVLRCPEGHLEAGQVYAAEDAGLVVA